MKLKLILLCIILNILYITSNITAKTYDPEATLYVITNKLSIENEPEGKKISKIIIITNEIFGKDDPTFPDMLNKFHTTTKKSFIQRELLFKEYDKYNEKDVYETIRIFKAMKIFRVVEIIPVKGNTSSDVELLIYTRDLWSIYIEGGLIGGGGENVATALFFENNMFGLYKYLGLGLSYGNATRMLSERYIDRRLFNTKLEFLEQVSLIHNKDTNKYEGEYIWTRIGRPLISRKDNFGFSFETIWLNQIYRDFRGTDVVAKKVPVSSTESEIVYQEYRKRCLQTEAKVIHSLGYETKYNFTYGLGFENRQYKYIQDVSERAEYLLRYYGYLPVNEKDPYLILGYDQNNFTYVRLVNFSTYRMIEDVPMGYQLSLQTDQAEKKLGSYDTFSRFTYIMGYQNILYNEDVYSVRTEISGKFLDRDVYNNWYKLKLANYFDQMWIGRFAIQFQCGFLLHPELKNNGPISYLGGNNFLRGFASKTFEGNKFVFSNIEYRFNPVRFLGFYWGFVTFYDTGNSFYNPQINKFSDIEKVRWYKSAGLGLRWLYPQAETNVFRVDFGWPLDPEYNPSKTHSKLYERFSFNFQHVF